jgi:hypothetical protein
LSALRGLRFTHTHVTLARNCANLDYLDACIDIHYEIAIVGANVEKIEIGLPKQVCFSAFLKTKLWSDARTRVSLHNFVFPFFRFLKNRKTKIRNTFYFCFFVLLKTEKRNYEAIQGPLYIGISLFETTLLVHRCKCSNFSCKH